MKLKIDTRKESGKIAFTLKGRLDTTTYLRLQDVVIPAFDEAKDIELDFAQITLLSTDGLRVLLAGQKKSQATGVPMTISNVSEEIMEVFRNTGFADILTIK